MKKKRLPGLRKKWWFPFRILRKSLTRQRDCEPLKPGRYREYYRHGRGVTPPRCFMSIDRERRSGSTPGWVLERWIKKHGLDGSKIDERIPQIAIIPKEEIGEYLLAEFERFNTAEKRREIEGYGLASTVASMSRKWLAAIDWAEQTYGIRIEVDPRILEWIEKEAP